MENRVLTSKEPQECPHELTSRWKKPLYRLRQCVSGAQRFLTVQLDTVGQDPPLAVSADGPVDNLKYLLVMGRSEACPNLRPIPMSA